MTNFEKDEEQILSHIHPKLSNDSKLLTRTHSISISILKENIEAQTPESKTKHFPSCSGMDENDLQNNYDGPNEHLVRSGPLGICNDPCCLICPTYLRVTQQHNANASGIFNHKFSNTLHGDASKNWARRLLTFFSLVPRIMNPHNKLVQRWNRTFYLCCLLSTFLDPFIFFLVSVQKENMCIVIDRLTGLSFLVIRSLIDFMHVLNIALQFRLAYVSDKSCSRPAHLIDNPKKIARNYLRSYFVMDFMVCFSLPQYLLILGFCEDYARLGILIFMQYFIRLIRILPNESGLFQAINLLIFLPSGHTVGSIWYFLGLQRVTDCLFKVCNSTTRCFCGPNGEPGLLKDNVNAIACLNSTSDAIPYGIYQDAVPLITETSVLRKFTFSLFWGFKQIITLGDNLTPSYKFKGEVYFPSLIDNHSYCFYTSLIRKNLSDIMRIKMAEHYNWAATRGVNEEALLENFPEDLQTDIRRHLFKFVKKVQIFALMDEPILDAIYERLKQKRYIIGSRILNEGGVVEKMVFFVRGKVESVSADGTRLLLSAGDVCGEELLAWYLEHASVRTDGKKVRLPGHRLVSNVSIRCLTNVEAFSLRLSDLEDLSILFTGFLQKPRVQGVIRYQLPHWRLCAAKRIQSAWRNWKRRCSLDTDSISNSN